MAPARITFVLVVAAASFLVAPTVAFAVDAPAATWRPANPSNYRPHGARLIDRIIIHKTEGTIGSAIDWFKNPASKVSAHYIVAHSGAITQMVAEKDVAYHCREWNGRSVGLENEGWTYRDDF